MVVFMVANFGRKGKREGKVSGEGKNLAKRKLVNFVF